MSTFTSNRVEAMEAMEHGTYVSEATPTGTRGDYLIESRFEIHDDWKGRGRPRLAARAKGDMNGGFESGMRVQLKETATSAHWVAQIKRIYPHPFAGKIGVVNDVTSADDALIVSVNFGGESNGVMVPGDWLRLAKQEAVNA